jgi:hypothetical protein
MQPQLKLWDEVIHHKRKAEIIEIIQTQKKFVSLGNEYLLFKFAGVDAARYELYKNDATKFPMSVIKYVDVMDSADVPPQYNLVSNKDLTLHESYSDFRRRVAPMAIDVVLRKLGGRSRKKRHQYRIKKSRYLLKTRR